MRRGAAVLLLPALLAACGDLPRPFAGKPGATAVALSRPPPARLAVPPPTGVLLPPTAAETFAAAVTEELVVREVPAVAGPVHPGDWRLDLTASQQGGQVVPHFTVSDPAGKARGTTDGPPVPAAAWAAATPDLLRQEAGASGLSIATLLTRIEAARRQNDPNSLVNRPPRVLVAEVTGAPGDGNRALSRQMRRILPQFGEIVTDTSQNADFTVAGTVHTAPGPGGATRVEIQWHITDAAGHDLGKVVQLNNVPAGSLDGVWGDVALVVAQEAANGVRDVIEKQTGARAAGQVPPPAAAGQTPGQVPKP
jgi:hypothetical protein